MPLPIKICIVVLASALLFGCTSRHGGTTDGSSELRKADATTKPYQATYSAPDNFAYQKEQFYSDGAGHFRIDISGNGPTVVNVLDLNKDETLMWAEETQQYFRRSSQPTDPLVIRVKLSKLQAADDAVPLGARVIKGHRCHGWRKADTEVWFDDDYGCHVVATTGGITSTLTEFSANAPDPSMFQPPPGYTQVLGRHVGRHKSRDRSYIIRDIERHMH